MRVEKNPLSGQIGRCVATLGSFDGVHRGHRCLLNQVRDIAAERDLTSMAITFGTSPKSVLGTASAPQLTSAVERTHLLHQLGMDEVALLDFTPQMAKMSARDFMQQVLREQLNVEVLVIGYDHRFGHGRTEGFSDYVRYGKELGIEIVRGEVCSENDEPISSTRIRHLLTEGEVDKAAHLLGYSYILYGEVIDGYKEGRKMGFPTANIHIADKEKLIPADGVYAVWVHCQQSTNDKQHSSNSLFKGMLNIGYRPTLNNGENRSIEVHLLDFNDSLYGQIITVEFVRRLREERSFSCVDELTEQLEEDRETVRELLANSINREEYSH